MARPLPRRRSVLSSTACPRKGRPRLFAYGYEDLGALLGMSAGAVRKAVSRGLFDPSDLRSVCEYALRRGVVQAPSPRASP